MFTLLNPNGDSYLVGLRVTVFPSSAMSPCLSGCAFLRSTFSFPRRPAVLPLPTSLFTSSKDHFSCLSWLCCFPFSNITWSSTSLKISKNTYTHIFLPHLPSFVHIPPFVVCSCFPSAFLLFWFHHSWRPAFQGHLVVDSRSLYLFSYFCLFFSSEHRFIEKNWERTPKSRRGSK